MSDAMSPNPKDRDQIYHGRTPDDFKTRRRDAWRDGQTPPAGHPGYVMVRLWNGQRFYYSIDVAEVEQFCEWLEWQHTTGSRYEAVAIRGQRCIHVVRLPPFIKLHLPTRRHRHDDELPDLVAHLHREFGEKYTRPILRDFF
jgi:hypothetical protein